MTLVDDERELKENLQAAIAQCLYEATLKELDPLEKGRDFSDVVYLEAVKKKEKNSSTIYFVRKGKNTTIYTNKPYNYWHGMSGKNIEIQGRIVELDQEKWLLVKSAEILTEMDLKGKPLYTQEDILKNTTVMNRLSYKQQRYLKEIMRKAKTYQEGTENRSSQEVESRPLFYSMEEMKAAYAVLKKVIPDEVCSHIERDMKGAERSSLISSSSETANAKKALFYLINYDWYGLDKPEQDADLIRKKIDQRLIGMEFAKKQLLQEVKVVSKTQNSPAAILLVGSDGSGCRSLAKEFLKAMNVKSTSFSLAGITDETLLTGTGRLYMNGSPSLLFMKCFEVGSKGGIILEQLDQTDAKCHSALMSLLERNYRDLFLETEIPLNDLWIIATANDTEKIPMSILKKMTVIHMERYTQEEKEKIITDIMFPEFAKNFHMGNCTISKEACNRIVQELAPGNNINIMKQIVREMFVSAQDRGEFGFCVNIKSFRDYFSLGDEKKVKSEYVRELSAMERKAQVCARFYPPTIRERNDKLLEIARYGAEQDKEYALKALRLTVNTLNDELTVVDMEKVKKELDLSHYGMLKAKKNIQKALASDMLGKEKRVKAILLDGCAGIGKTSIARSIAKALGRKFVKIPLNGISNTEELRGYSRTINDSHAGIIVNGLAKEEVCSYGAVVLLDEVDKMIVNQRDDPYTALYDLLDADGGYWNNYLETYIPTENLLFILTSNNKSKVPQTILDRVQVIELEGYSLSEKSIIAKDYVIPRFATNYNLNAIEISDEDLSYLLTNYCNSHGVRDVERAIENVLCEKAVECNMILPKVCKISRRDFVKALGAKKLPMDDCPISKEYGQARALAVAGTYGCSFAIQVVDLPFGKSDIVTGLAKGSFAESIETVKTLVSRILKQPLPYLHVHVTDAGMEKDGPSAGIALFIAIMSFMKKSLSNDLIASTGTVDLFGNVGVIGGLKLKLAAAERTGVKRVFVPKENYEQLLDDGEIELFSLDICPVTNVYQVMEEVFPNFEDTTITSEEYSESEVKHVGE